jgi:hypothetical protein
MANYKGNLMALQDVLFGQATHYEDHLVQDKIDINRQPFYSPTYPVGSTGWKRIDVTGYEVLVLAGDEVRSLNGAPAYLRFGTLGPEDNTATTSIEGAMPALPGTRVTVPQGFGTLWFLPDPSISWRLVICRLPKVSTEYGPYGAGLLRAGATVVEQRLGPLSMLANATRVLWTSADIEAAGALGLPLVARFALTGGGPVTRSTQDYPAELLVREWNGTTQACDHSYPLPGDGRAYIEVPLFTTQRYGDAGKTKPAIEVSIINPGGDKTNICVNASLRVALGGEEVRAKYQGVFGVTGKSGTEIAGSVCMPAGPYYVAYDTKNNGTQALTLDIEEYLPAAMGGGIVSNQNAVHVNAGASANGLVVNYTGYVLATWSYDVDPGGAGAFVASVSVGQLAG